MQRHPALFALDVTHLGVENALDRLDDPLWPSRPNTRRLAELCVLTTLRCERASRAQAKASSSALNGEGGDTSTSRTSPFDGQDGVALRETVRKYSGGTFGGVGKTQKHNDGDPLQTLRELGLLELFPHMDGLARAGSINHQHSKSRKSSAWEYFEHVGKMQQLVCVAESLSKHGAGSARNPSNTKYVAHQIALLYQGVNSVRGELKQFKPEIERKFETIKKETERLETAFDAARNDADKNGNTKCGADPRPLLSDQHVAWVETVAHEIAQSVRSFPPQASEKIRGMAKAVAGEGRA